MPAVPPAQAPSLGMESASPPPVAVLPLQDLSRASFGSEIFPGPLETKPPLVKVTKPADDYDPNHIPASIFSREPNNPGEWSISSNDSLFSIQNSFSRNSSILRGMPDPEDSNLPEAKSDESSLMDVPAHKESSVISGLKKDPNHIEKVTKGEAIKNQEKIARTSMNNARISDGSANSGSSFAFPVLMKDAGKEGSVNWAMENPEKPQLPQEQQQQVPEVVPPLKAAASKKKKRFCCFPCWYWCCCCGCR